MGRMVGQAQISASQFSIGSTNENGWEGARNMPVSGVPSQKIQLACLLAAIAVLALSIPVMAQAESATAADGFAWSAQKATIDFSSPDSGRQFSALVQEAHEKTILYLDWTLLNAAQTRWGRAIARKGEESAADDAVCKIIEREAISSDGIVISGKPDPDNNHLLFEMAVNLTAGAPFARARCEYAQSRIGLRLRGFFYVTDIETATANRLEFTPISVPAHTVPPAFRKHLR